MGTFQCPKKITSFAKLYGFARIRTGVTGTQGPKYGQANPRTLTPFYRVGTVKGFVPSRSLGFERDVERSTLAGLGFNPDTDVVVGADPFADRQSNSASLVVDRCSNT